MAAAILLGALFGLHRIAEPDLFQQVAVGRAILSDPSSIGRSTFHHTVPDYPYVADKWLASVLVALLDRVGGEHALMLYQVLLTALFAAACFSLFRRSDASSPAALLGVCLVLAACAFRLEPRPETLSLVMIVFLTGRLVSSLPYRHLLAVVPALFVVWVNLHGYFAIGLIVLATSSAAAALGDRASHGARGGERGAAAIERLALLGLALLACLIHPQGPRALAWPVRQLWILHDRPYLREAIEEFRPSLTLLTGMEAWRWVLLGTTVIAALWIGAKDARRVGLRAAGGVVFALPWVVAPPPGLTAWPYRLSFALWVAALFEIVPSVRRRRWSGPLLLGGFTLLGLPLIRNLSLVPIGALLLLVPTWSRVFDPPKTPAGQSLRRRPVVGSILAIAALFVVGWARLADRLPPGGERSPSWTGWGVDRASLPVDASDFVERTGAPGPLLNHFDNGGYLLYRFHPDRAAFISGNTSMYPGEFFRDFHRRVIGRDAELDAIVSRYGVRTAVLSHASSEISNLSGKLARSPSWYLVHLDRSAAVFVRDDEGRSGPIRPPRVDLEQRAAELLKEPAQSSPLPSWLAPRRRLFPDLNLGLFLRATGRADLALAELDRLWAAGPDVHLAEFAAATCEEMGDLPRSVPYLEWALARSEDDASVRSWLSRALYFRAVRSLERDHVLDARSDLLRVLTLSPDEPGPSLALARVELDEGRLDAARVRLGDALRLDRDGTIRRAVQGDPRLAPLMPDLGERESTKMD